MRAFLRPVAAVVATLGLAWPAAAQPVLWAWERPEALAELPSSYGVAAVVGVVRIRGGAMTARGRRFPLVLAAGRPQPTAVVHVEIDQAVPLDWTAVLEREVAGAALGFARGYAAVQVDMEVRESQRGALLGLLRAVRTGLAPGVTLSMTALASWCDTEGWLDAAPVDEIVPMLFRMGVGGTRLRDRLAAGGDFQVRRCRTAVGVSLDAPVAVPAGRRVYLFNPRSWDAASLGALVAENGP